VRRGEVYWANLAPRSGSEQKGRRPVIIVSHDAFNRSAGWRTAIIVPVSTSSAQSRRGPTVIPLPSGSGGLPRSSLALCHQVATLDRAKLERRLGALPRELMREIEEGLALAMDLETAGQ
jgi:mRNA interferase MazF